MARKRPPKEHGDEAVLAIERAILRHAGYIDDEAAEGEVDNGFLLSQAQQIAVLGEARSAIRYAQDARRWWPKGTTP